MKISSSRPVSSGMRIFFFCILILAGAFILYFGGRDILRANASEDWPSARGKIVSSSVQGHRSRSGSRGTRKTYRAKIQYEFAVNGAVITGSRVAYGDHSSGSRLRARSIVDRYPEGREVEVYYMPGDPGECLLEPGLKAQAFLVPGIGAVFLAAGILMAVHLPRTRSRSDRNNSLNGKEISP